MCFRFLVIIHFSRVAVKSSSIIYTNTSLVKMVLSGSWRTTYVRSIISQNQGGGSKKAGTPPTTNIPDSVYNAYVERGNGLLSLVNMRKNRFKRFPSQNLPVNMVTSPRAHMQ